MGVSNMTLVKIAALGGVATVTMGLLLRNQINSNIKSTEFYKDAMKTLRNHEGAINLLGEPIKDRTIDIESGTKNYVKENNAKFEVPVKGSKNKGILYLWAEKKKPDDSWHVQRIELELANDTSRRLLIKSSSD